MQGGRALLVAAILLTVGCIGAVAEGTPAMEHRDTADERAQEIDAEGELLSVNAFETNQTPEDVPQNPQGPSPADVVHDDRIGDGGPPAWVYEYRLDNATLDVIVSDDGTVLHEERDDDVEEDAVPLGDWEVTSVEAVDIVQDNNASWTISEEGMAFYHLSREDDEETEEVGDPIWRMGRVSMDSGLMVASVNAMTGEFLGAESVDFGGTIPSFSFGSGGSGDGDGSPPQEGNTFSGTVGIVEDTSEHSFEIGLEEHPSLGVGIVLDDAGAGTVQATIEGPDGDLGTLEVDSDDPIDSQRWAEPTTGEYTITVELQDGVEEDYGVAWCAEGAFEGDEDAQQACERIEQAEQAGSGQQVRLLP